MLTPNEIMHINHSRTFKTLDDLIAYLSSQQPELGPEDEVIEADYASNAPCDFSGYCAGTGCPYFFQCKGD